LFSSYLLCKKKKGKRWYTASAEEK
jgi:hypothetical protein